MAEGAIRYVTQQSELRTLPDGTRMSPKVWVEVEPQITGMTIQLPAWTAYAQERVFQVPAAALSIQAHATRARSMMVYLLLGKEQARYALLDINESVLPEDADATALSLLWFEVPPGTTDLTRVTVHVLRHVQQ